MFKLNHFAILNVIKNQHKSFSRNCKTLSSGPKAESAVQVENEVSVEKDMFISDIKNPFEPKERQCILCKYKIALDYKNPKLLSQFISPYTGFIYDKHITNLCDAQQQKLIKAITMSRGLGYMPYMLKDPKYVKDPKLFDPFSPERPNPH